ncbi:MAG: NAD-dependent epimerase/dehydratase family protein, partial [bacterium]
MTPAADPAPAADPTPVAANHWAGRRVVVTGGRGFLGTWTTRQLEAEGARVTPLGRADFDLTEQADVRRLFAELRPEVVVHLAAACGGIGANVANPGHFLHANAAMGLHLLEEARRAGGVPLVLISTTCAYPEAAPIPLREETLWDGRPTGATGPYGLAKRLLHEALAAYHRQYDQPGVVLIPANLYGPGDHFEPENSHVVAALIRRFVEAADADAPEVVGWGTGSPTREFL